MRRHNTLLWAILFLATSCFGTVSLADCQADAPRDPMRFLVMSDGSDRWISAEGRISVDTAAVFRRFLEQLSDAPDTVILHSLGGRLDGGLALGRVIRDAGLATRVGDTVDCDGEDRRADRVCASACAYAFLGGVRRDVGPSGVLGFHAIYPAEGQDLPDAATIAAATETALRGLESYLIEMGINPVLSEIAALVERDSLFLPARAERNALGIETSVPQVAGLAEPGAAQL